MCVFLGNMFGGGGLCVDCFVFFVSASLLFLLFFVYCFLCGYVLYLVFLFFLSTTATKATKTSHPPPLLHFYQMLHPLNNRLFKT